ncbi:hypothetical protein KCMC57_65040 (plasmid) [Kitasatospora sp. CMC57]|uniref:Uncharacterized protein n=1 Tax=Kitasatospora sp. CMC57 TaxID=3231513 RepID=A0AB33K3S1_9ACTN
MSDYKTPYDAADAAAEAVRALNHLTIDGRWAESPSDVSDVAQALARLSQRLPQALQQVYRELDRLDRADAIRMDNGTDPGVEAGRALAALKRTRALAEQLQSSMLTVAQGLDHMGGHFDPANAVEFDNEDE